MKYVVAILCISMCLSCAMVSQQYYYVPSVSHQIIKHNYRPAGLKVVNSRFKISNRLGDSIGEITINNGPGQPLWMGPLVPVVPVFWMYYKRNQQFMMDIMVKCDTSRLKDLAIAGNYQKAKSDSLNVLAINSRQQLTDQCYLVVNDTLKVPLGTYENYGRGKMGHNYQMAADIPFAKIKTIKLVTGNALLDSTLRNITFKRKSRIVFDMLGPGY